MSELAERAADPQQDVMHLGGDLFHSVGGFVVLLVPLVQHLQAPGLTRHGWRVQKGAATR